MNWRVQSPLVMGSLDWHPPARFPADHIGFCFFPIIRNDPMVVGDMDNLSDTSGWHGLKLMIRTPFHIFLQ